MARGRLRRRSASRFPGSGYARRRSTNAQPCRLQDFVSRLLTLVASSLRFFFVIVVITVIEIRQVTIVGRRLSVVVLFSLSV